MKFDLFVQNLVKKLQLELPGALAHEPYMHKSRLENKLEPNEKTKNSAVLIVFYPKDNEIYFPLILRPIYDGTHGGQMALPGGKMEPTDENLTRTALREAEEEIGIKALDVRVLGELTEIFIPISNFTVKPIIGSLDYTPVFFPDPKEVDKVFEIPILNFGEYHPKGSQIVTAGLREMHVPGFQIVDQWLWGATALIINELLMVLDIK